MRPNPLLKRLGLADDDRAIIVHADDIGSSQASLAAYTSLLDGDVLSSASAIVPGPWFPAVAAFCREHATRGNADQVDANRRFDMGVHITLTSEQSGCRWRPLSTRDPATGLLDTDGYFHNKPENLRKQGDPTAAGLEMQAQIERALAAGIDVTHIDTHEFTVAERPEFFESYIQVAMKYRVPPLLVRGSLIHLSKVGQGGSGISATGAIAEYMNVLETQGLPVLDNLFLVPLSTPEGRLGQIQRMLASLKPGISELILHPAQDTPELRAFSKDWQARAADYVAFKSQAMREIFQDAGIHVIGWRVLRDLMRAAM